MQELRIIPLPMSGDVRPGDSLVDKFLNALKRRRMSLAKGDILVVKHKIVSKAEGQLIRLDTIKASARSRAWAIRYKLDARVTELVLQQSKTIIRRKNGVLITETRHGFMLRVRFDAVAHELTCAAGRRLDKLTRTPFVISRGFHHQPGHRSSRQLLRPAALDLFR